jgi:hypothetical protein
VIIEPEAARFFNVYKLMVRSIERMAGITYVRATDRFDVARPPVPLAMRR